MAQRQAPGIMGVLAIAALLCGAPALASEMIFESDGSSLDPFFCHYIDPAVVPTINATDGIPEPSIEFATADIANYSFAPYVLPSLHEGQTLLGTLDFLISGEKNYVEIAGFGASISASCDYDPDTGPADGRWPLPSIFYASNEGALYVEYRNKEHDIVRERVPYELSLGSWHHAELSIAPSDDPDAPGTYDFELLIDAAPVFAGRSAEEIRDGDALGVLLGAVGSGYASRVAYDNVQVQLRDTPTCRYGPADEPWVFTRGRGAPVTETKTWDSCGGPGTMQLTLDHVSSALVYLNGVLVLGPDAFDANVTEIGVPVELLAGENQLQVELRGKPGSSLSVSFVSGERRQRDAELLPRRQLLLHAPEHVLPAHGPVRARAHLEMG